MKTRKQCRGNWLMTGLVLLAVCGIMGTARATTNTWNGPGTGGVWDKSNSNWDTLQTDPWNSSNGTTNVAYFNTAITNDMSGVLYLNSVVLNKRCVIDSSSATSATNYFVGSNPTILLDVGHPVFGSSATRSQFGSLSLAIIGVNGLTIRSASGTSRLLDFWVNATNLFGGIHVEPGVNLGVTVAAEKALGGNDVYLTSAALWLSSGTFSAAKNVFHANASSIVFNNTTVDFQGAVNLAGDLTVRANSASYYPAVTISGVISNSAPGNLAFAMETTNVLTLSAANTYSGTTTVSSGYVLLKNANAMQNSTLGGAPTNRIRFDASVASKAFVFGGLAARSGAIALTNTTGNAVSLLVGNNNASTTSGVAFTESGSFVKVGSGTLMLTNANTYSGATIVSNGTLALSASGSLSSTNWTISSGATLSVGSAVDLNGKALTVDAGGTVSGLLTVAGNLALGGGSLTVTGMVEESRRIAVCSGGTISGTFGSAVLPPRLKLDVKADEIWVKLVRGTMIQVF